MGPGPVFFMAVVMGGATLMTYTILHFVYKIKKIKSESPSRGLNERLSRQMDKLVANNASLQRRIETLESIVVDTERGLQTGLDSQTERPYQESTSIEVNIDEDLIL